MGAQRARLPRGPMVTAFMQRRSRYYAYARLWPIATDDALTANGRFQGIADMDRFSSRNDL